MIRNSRFIMAGVIILFLAFVTAPSYGAKYALIVGVNDYINYSEADEVDLSGCENDAMFIKDLLIDHYGFDNNNIIMLLSQDAIKENIEGAFQDLLIDRCKPGDTAVFYFSGHGTYFDDYNGDEEDGYDEGLCPADMDDYSIENYIVDDDFAKWISQVKTDNFTIILDCCYSGTATKSLTSGRTKFFKNAMCKGSPGMVPDTELLSESPITGYTLITGCAEDQTSHEDDWTYNDQDVFRAGVMTINFIDSLYNSVPGVTTYEEVMDDTITTIKSYGYEQDPQLAGNYNRPVFYGGPGDAPEVNQDTEGPNTGSDTDDINTEEETPSKSYILITGLDGSKVELGAGFANKITVGSLYEVYPPGETSFSGSGTGVIQITSVSSLFSEGTILEGTVNKNGRAVEVARNFGNRGLNIYVNDRDLKNGLAEKFASIDYIYLTDRAEICDRIIEGNISDEGVYVHLYSRDGREIVKTSGDIEDVVNLLRPYLDNAYAIKELASLSNPSPDFKINIRTDRGKNPSYKINDLISFEFEADRDCYLTLIDISTDGSITILFPNKYNYDNRVEAGETYIIPAKDMGYQVRVTGPAGNEMVKAIATEEPVDISKLTPECVQAGFKALEGSKGGTDFIGNLSSLLSGSLNGNQYNNSKGIIPVDGWATAEMIISIDE